jgi:putative solute:sodium symporter small subunit
VAGPQYAYPEGASAGDADQEEGRMAEPREVDQRTREAYWRETSRFTWLIVILWFISWVGPLVLHSWLNQFVIFGFPLSYWFAGQGSLAIFIVLIVWYAVKMNQLDRKYGLQEEGV